MPSWPTACAAAAACCAGGLFCTARATRAPAPLPLIQYDAIEPAERRAIEGVFDVTPRQMADELRRCLLDEFGFDVDAADPPRVPALASFRSYAFTLESAKAVYRLCGACSDDASWDVLPEWSACFPVNLQPHTTDNAGQIMMAAVRDTLTYALRTAFTTVRITLPPDHIAREVLFPAACCHRPDCAQLLRHFTALQQPPA